jgi:hypothetical protein
VVQFGFIGDGDLFVQQCLNDRPFDIVFVSFLLNALSQLLSIQNPRLSQFGIKISIQKYIFSKEMLEVGQLDGYLAVGLGGSAEVVEVVGEV